MSNTQLIYNFVKDKIEFLDKESPWAKAALAKLRRGIGSEPGGIPELWEITLSDLPDKLSCQGWGDTYQPTEAEWAIHTALTLYALHRQGKNKTMNTTKKENDNAMVYGNSIGAAARKLKKPDGSNELSIKRRFDAMATSKDLFELAHHARGLVQLLKAADPPITLDYASFAVDLYRYQNINWQNQVRLRWGQDFWVQSKDYEEKSSDMKEGETL